MAYPSGDGGGGGEGVINGGISSAIAPPYLPPPLPKSPPEYPDLYGKRKEAARVQTLSVANAQIVTALGLNVASAALLLVVVVVRDRAVHVSKVVVVVLIWTYPVAFPPVFAVALHHRV
ncbi:unnamed protein product [Cochlearia groenlandica]